MSVSKWMALGGEPATDEEMEERRRRLDRELVADYHRDRLSIIGCPDAIADTIRAGKDEHGRRLITSEPERWLRDKMENGRRLMLLCGKLGTGKTMAACRWLADQQGTDSVFLFRLAVDVCRLSPDFSKTDPELRQLATVRVLVLDEVGTTQEEDKHRARLEGLLHRRFDAGLVTILLSNLTPSEFVDRYHARIVSRVYDSGGIYGCREVLRLGEQQRTGGQR